PGDRPPYRDFIRNDEMLEVDKGGCNDEGDKSPVSDCDLPRKRFPNDEEEESGQQFDQEIAEGDARAAIGAASAQQQPANERQILVRWNLSFAGRTKGTPRLVDREI